MATELWTERYRPKTLDGYVFNNDQQRQQVERWIKDKSIGNLLILGGAGRGKTTLAKILFNELEINPFDILELNASRSNSIDDVREKITNFVQMIPFGSFKVVLLDEFDFFSLQAQAALRGVMEEYHETARFILTGNYSNKIIPAIHSRCQSFPIETIDHTEYTARVATILMNENVKFDLDTLDTYVKASYPDLRKCINNIQMNSLDGVLQTPQSDSSGSADYRLEMVNLFKAGKIREARKLVCSQARPEEHDSIYRWMYDNIEIFGDEEKQDKAILIIQKGIVDQVAMSDTEINLAAVMIRLSKL